MFNPKGDGFPAAYDTPERQEEYKQFYLQCFNNFFKKNYQDETKCRQFLRKEMQALQKKIILCIQAAETTEYETGRKTIYYRSLSVNSMSHYPPTTK